MYAVDFLNNTFQSLGLLILRVIVGIIFIANGWMMLTRWGIDGTTASFAGSGIPMAGFVALFSIAVELIGGILFILGFGTRLIGLAYLVVSLGAIYFVHWAKGIYVAEGGFEYVMLLGACGLLFALIGPGKFSIDHMIAKAFRKKKQNRAVENHVVDAEPVAAYSA